jgi:UDP-N-acetylmuramate dehydrogenase
MSCVQKIQKDVFLKTYTTFGIGGPARYFLQAHTRQEMCEAMLFAQQENLPFLILGKGSNALFDDRGYNGLIILNKIQGIMWKDTSVEVGSGYSFSLLGVQSARKGLSGLEFAAGIPGSVGGAVFMNAGANKQDTAHALVDVGFIDTQGNYRVYIRDELMFAYRKSSFQNLKGSIVSATFRFIPLEEARKKQLEIIDYRAKTQPYGEHSAGCIFRNPSHKSAGALIEAAGLKGYRIGGACISPIHANFIVNDGNACAQDVMDLVALIKERVFQHAGEKLEMEVIRVPYKDLTRENGI